MGCGREHGEEEAGDFAGAGEGVKGEEEGGQVGCLHFEEVTELDGDCCSES